MNSIIWPFLAGVAIVLFGMDLLEKTISEFSGSTLKKWLKKVSNNAWSSFLSGTGLSAILQSSSVTIIIIMTFISVGYISLSNAVGAVLGANVGSTLLGIIVVYVGFSFNMSSFSLGMVAIGGLMYKFIKRFFWQNIGKIILSFGFLFYGISLLKDSVGSFANSIDLSSFSQIPIWGWFGIGILLTALLSSSGAMTIITLGALHAGAITFPQSIAIIAGANIGTGINAIRASLGGVAGKKQVAAIHIGYNIFASVLVMICIYPLASLFQEIYDFSKPGSQETALALLQLLYNIIASLIVLPFSKTISKILQKIYPPKVLDYELGIQKIGLTEVDISIPILKKDIIMLLKKIFKFNVHHLRIDQKALLNKDISLEKKMSIEYILDDQALSEDYTTCKIIEEDILTYILKTLRFTNLSDNTVQYLQKLHYSVERMMYAAKAWKDTSHASSVLFNSENIFIKSRIQELKNNMIGLYYTISQIIDNTEIEKNYQLIESVAKIIKEDNRKFLLEISAYIEKNDLEEGLLSELIHLSQSYERSNDAIVDAIRILFLEKNTL